VFRSGSFDFSVPAPIVPCESAHDNEVVDLVDISPGAGGAYPGEEAAQAEANEKCDAAFEAFLGRPVADTYLAAFVVFPNEVDWQSGARVASCSIYAEEALLGTAASGSLKVPGMALAVLHEVDGRLDVWIMDAGTGALTTNLTGDFDGAPLRSPTTWARDGAVIAFAAKSANAGPGDEGDLYLASTDGLGILGITPVFEGEDAAEEDRPVIGPVGFVIAFISNAESEEFEIYVIDLENEGAVTRLTEYEDRDSSPTWSPDGTQIAFRRRIDGNSEIFVMNSDGSNVRQLTDDPAFDGDPNWSPDGSEIIFTSDRSGNYDIWVMNADGTDQAQITNHPAADEYPWWSPDGEYIAFQSNRHGATQIWVMRWDGSDVSLLANDAPTGYPTWSPVTLDG
jgi:Tol biopolymer transport system component